MPSVTNYAQNYAGIIDGSLYSAIKYICITSIIHWQVCVYKKINNDAYVSQHTYILQVSKFSCISTL